jgi:NAD+ kinase
MGAFIPVHYNGEYSGAAPLTILKTIGVLAHPRRPQTAPVAETITDQLQARGIETWVCTDWTEEDVRDLVSGSDMVVAIGGDGAMLRAARVCAFYGVPVLGVNMGNLGFLTEIDDPAKSEQHFDKLLTDDYWIETRMMVKAQVWRGDNVIAEEDALNDVVINRSTVTSIVRLEMYIDQDWATTYNADALIIATATGSTAYALASGGPILPPELHNILVIPVAPHLSMDRSIVLSQGAVVDVIVGDGSTIEVALTVDGIIVKTLKSGDRIQVQASDHISRFVRMRSRNYFYRSLLDRLEPRISLPEPRKWINRNA